MCYSSVAFLCSFYFTCHRIWARPNQCAQNQYTDVENGRYQSLILLRLKGKARILCQLPFYQELGI